MPSVKEIAWVSGIVEGEGYIALSGRGPKSREKRHSLQPVISISMTDKDVIQRLNEITGWRMYGPYQHVGNRKPFYRVQSGGSKLTISWLMTMLPLLGRRRKARAIEVIQYWKTKPNFSQAATLREERKRQKREH